MAKCTKRHVVNKNKVELIVSCYYIAGICIVDPIHQGGLEMFLRSTYPYYHSPQYLLSKVMHEHPVPNNIQSANFNE